MRLIVAGLAAVLLVGCSSTENEPRQSPSASADVAQDQVDQFCRDLADVLTRDGTADPEDTQERVAELSELANELGLSTRDDLSVAQHLEECADELRAATASPTPTG